MIETNIQSPDVFTCEAFCKINQREGCKYWEWSRERAACNLYDSAEKQCNIVFGPRNGAPGDCGATTPGTTTTGSTCPYDNGYFKDAHNCGRYFVCKNGVVESFSCKNATFDGLYDYNLEWCNWPHKVDCEDRPICGGNPPEYTNCQCQGAETVTEFSCPNTPNVEFLIDPFNCQHMIVCHGGSQIHDAYCWDGQYFNYQTGTCVLGDGSVCGGRPICQDKENSKDCYCYQK